MAVEEDGTGPLVTMAPDLVTLAIILGIIIITMDTDGIGQ